VAHGASVFILPKGPLRGAGAVPRARHRMQSPSRLGNASLSGDNLTCFQTDKQDLNLFAVMATVKCSVDSNPSADAAGRQGQQVPHEVTRHRSRVEHAPLHVSESQCVRSTPHCTRFLPALRHRHGSEDEKSQGRTDCAILSKRGAVLLVGLDRRDAIDSILGTALPSHPGLSPSSRRAGVFRPARSLFR